MANLLAKKPISIIMAESQETGEHCLKRALGATNLISLGIGAIIGTGIFVLTGAAAAQYAGPAIIFSFILAAIGCVFAGLCYAEFASMIPIAGSAYTYGYATLGEILPGSLAGISFWNTHSAPRPLPRDGVGTCSVCCRILEFTFRHGWRVLRGRPL